MKNKLQNIFKKAEMQHVNFVMQLNQKLKLNYNFE